jgi:RHS repeat-associated protein
VSKSRRTLFGIPFVFGGQRRSRIGRTVTPILALAVMLPTVAYAQNHVGPPRRIVSSPPAPLFKPKPTRVGINFDAAALAKKLNLLNGSRIHPLVCGGSPYRPPVSQDQLAWVAVANSNEVEMVNEATGSVYGSPIALPTGSNPTSIAYWQPSPGSSATTSDPFVITANSNDTVSFINTVTKIVVSTLSLGSGSNPTSIAASTTSDFAVVSDTASGSARVQMINMHTRAIVKTFSTVATGSNLISQVIFDPSGVWVNAADPTQHKIFSFEQTSSSAPYFTQPTGSTYTGASSFNPIGLAADETNSAATSLFVTSNGSTTKLWNFTNDPPSSPSSVYTFSGGAPSKLVLSPGAVDAYVVIPSTSKVDVITLSGTVTMTAYSTTTTPGALSVNPGTGVLYVGDNASGATDAQLYNWAGNTPTLTLQNTASLDGVASSIATPTANFIHYDAFAVTPTAIQVVDTSTGLLIQTISDANTPISVSPSPDGRYLYVVNAQGSGSGGLNPQVQVIATAALGTSSAPIIATYAIPKTQSTPYSYSLTYIPTPTQAALSPSGTVLVIADSANSVLLSVDVGLFDTNKGHVMGQSALNGSTGESPQAVSFSPDGTNVYVSVQPGGGGTGGITNYTFSSSTGTYLSPSYQSGSSLGDSASHTLHAPTTIVTSNDGRSLVVLDTYSSSPRLFQFPRSTSGALSNEGVTAIPAGTTPVNFALSATNAVAFVSDSSTNVTSAVDMTNDGSSGNVLYTSAADVLAGVTASTPDGQYFATADASTFSGCTTHGVDGLSIYSTADGTNLADVSLGTQPSMIVITPVSASVTEASTSAFQGQLGWAELLGGSNPSEIASTSMVDVNSAGSPSDAPGVSAGTNTDLRSYELSLDAMSVPSVGPSLAVTARYDSAWIANGVDTTSTPSSFANGWRLSTGVTFSQNPTTGLFPCEIHVSQADGSQVNFEPSTPAPYSSCPTSNYEAPPWAQVALSTAASCSGTDSCWVVTNETSDEATYIDRTASAHQIVKIVDRNSNTLSFNYTSGVLTSESESGRSLSFTYPTAGTGTCSSTFNSSTVGKCMVVTDPIGRTATFYLANVSGSAYNLIGETLAPSTGSGSASYAFSYSSYLLTNWWTPQNFATYGSSTAEATDVSYAGSGLDWVTQVTAPQVSNQGVSMSDTYTPTTTYSYPVQDLYSGTGTVIITDANAIWNAAHSTSTPLPGANITLDYYVDWGLANQVQGYGPAENSNTFTITSQNATTLRDPLTLMPDETISPLADNGSGTLFNAGTTFYTYDALANVLAVTTPGPTASSWATVTNRYNSFDEQQSSADALGNITSYSYDTHGNLLTTTSPPTNNWTSAPVSSSYYNSDGTICASRDANEVSTYGVLSSCSTSHDTYFTYNTYGDQTASTDPLGDVTSSYFDGDGNSCASLSANGYATGERLSSCPSSAQSDESVVLTRNVYNNVTSSTTPSNAAGGTSWTYFNLNNDQIASVSVLGNPSTCNPITTSTCLYTNYSVTNPDGAVMSSTSSTPSSGTVGPTSTSFFDPNGASVASVPPSGNVSGATPANFERVSISNSIGTIVSSTPAASIGASCSFASSSSLCPNSSFAQSDPAGNVTATYAANSSGAGTVASTSGFDPAGNVASSQVATSSSSTSTISSNYDLNGNALTSTTVGSSTGGTITTGSTTTYEMGGAVCWSSPINWTSGTPPSCSSPPTGTGTQTTMNYYDRDGHLVAVSGPGSNPYASANTAGCNPLTTSTCSFTTYYTYDEVGRQTSSVQPQDPSSNYPTTTNYYNAGGNQIAVTMPGGSPGSCNPVTTSTCTDTVYRSYDAVGRVHIISYTDGTPTVTFSYNNDGSRASMIDGTGTSSYSYDSTGRLVSTTNGAGAVDTWSYNAAGQQICLSYPNSSGNTCATSGASTAAPPTGDLSYSYDSLGRLSTQSTWTGVTLTYAYDCAGGVAWISTGTATQTECSAASDSNPAIPTTSSAVTTSYTNDSTSGLLSQEATTTSNGATNLVKFAFGRDQQGRLTSSTPTTNSTTLAVDNYSYDGTNRVSSGPKVGSTGSNSYAYTDQGGITAATNTFSAAAYSPSGSLCWTNPTTSGSCGTAPSGSTAYGYNSDGERTAVTPPTGGNPQSLAWSTSSQRLICMNINGTACSTASPTSTTWLYGYNGDGLRSWTLHLGLTESLTWNASNSQLLSDSSHDYIYGLDSTIPIMQIQTADFVTTPANDLIVIDSNHNVRAVVQLQGDTGSYDNSLVNYTDYDAFGNPISESGGALIPGGLLGTVGITQLTSSFGFGSGYQDPTSLSLLIHRVYDSTIGQFISIDPLLSHTKQPFEYSQDNPVMNYDPSGLLAEPNANSDNRVPLGCGENVGRSVDGTVYLDMISNCVAHNVKWIMGLTGPIVPFVIGNVDELGMLWWRNGWEQNFGSAHSYPPPGRFHGTFRDIYVGDYFRISDHLRYTAQYNIGDVVETANVLDWIHPRFRQSGGKPIDFTMAK